MTLIKFMGIFFMHLKCTQTKYALKKCTNNEFCTYDINMHLKCT